MVRAVDEPHADALHRRAGELAVRHRLLDALVDGGPEALRDDAADDLVDELVADAALDRLDHDVAVAELAAAARLLLVAARARAPRSGSSPGTARAAGAARRRRRSAACARSSATSTCIWLMPGEDLLPGLLVAAQPQRRVLLGEPADRGRDLLLLALDAAA